MLGRDCKEQRGANVKGCWGNCKEAQGETETVKSSRHLLCRGSGQL